MRRWNFSSRARELSGGDAIFISIPKSGRTWIRTFLNAYFSYKVGRQFSLDLTDHGAAGVPRIIYSHDRFEHRTKGNAWDRLRRKYLIPRRALRKRPIVLLARDPRDTFVSYFVQLTRRNPATPNEVQEMSVDALLRHPRFGIGAMVDVMNDWIEEFGDRSDFTIVRYEDFRAEPARLFHELLRAIGEKEIDEPVFGPAIDFSDFRNMQKLEAAGGFGSKILQPRDREDPESFKVRQGKVGGFRDYLSGESQRYADETCAALNPRFGYLINRAVIKRENHITPPIG
jgi:Sulfotransferase domain